MILICIMALSGISNFPLDEANALMGEKVKTYAHIVVDEAQDLSPMQVRAISRRARTGATTIAGDIAQSTGLWARNSWADILDEINTDLPKAIETLQYGYRVPGEIMDLAAKVLPYAAPGVESPQAVRRTGHQPQLMQLPQSDSHLEIVVAELVHLVDENKYIGVVVPDAVRAALIAELNSSRVEYCDADKGKLDSGINIVSPAGAKGLEFDVVVLVEPQQIIESDAEFGQRLLYIALTRATQELSIFFSEGQLPESLGGSAKSEPVASQVNLSAGATSLVVPLAIPVDTDQKLWALGMLPEVGAPAAETSAVAPKVITENPEKSVNSTLPHTIMGSASGAAAVTEPAAEVAAPTELQPAKPRIAPKFSERQMRLIEQERLEIVERLQETIPQSLWEEILHRALTTIKADQGAVELDIQRDYDENGGKHLRLPSAVD